jgi:hypothetical protein
MTQEIFWAAYIWHNANKAGKTLYSFLLERSLEDKLSEEEEICTVLSSGLLYHGILEYLTLSRKTRIPYCITENSHTNILHNKGKFES